MEKYDIFFIELFTFVWILILEDMIYKEEICVLSSLISMIIKYLYKSKDFERK